MLTLWPQFREHFSWAANESYTPLCVRGFFENGGKVCYVVPLAANSSRELLNGLEQISALDTIDLVCAPDISLSHEPLFELQQLVVTHCDRLNDRFAILDSPRVNSATEIAKQWHEIDGYNGAIYYPWLKVHGISSDETLVPPCGHLAGVYARTDRRIGVHKAPANEIVAGVLDLQFPISSTQQDSLNANGINCLRSFPRRGIRVWGARTVSGLEAWKYVNVRRVFLTAVRWISRNARGFAFEPIDTGLCRSVERELKSYFLDQLRRGALRGRTPDEAFYVKCNTEEDRLITDLGLAANNPYEFVVVRMIHGENGVEMRGPIGPS